MNIWGLIGGLIALIALILWVRWLRTPSPSATWPRLDTLRLPFLYIIPVALMAFSAMGITEFARSLGASETIESFTYGLPALIMIPLMVMGVLDFLGAPAVPILVPRWIREQDREYRTMKRTARRRRWQDPKVKRAEIQAAITGPIMAVVVAAAIFFVFFVIGNLLF